MLRDIAPKAKAGTTRRARGLRGDMSLPEVLLWRVLRGRPQGLKFRRQHPSGAFVLDFFCSDARLAIEIDGEIHGAEDRQMRDAARDAWFGAAGIETLRVSARDVLQNVDLVVDQIVALALVRLPLHHPALPDGPPPRDKLGED